MNLDRKLTALRDCVQQDVGGRGLARECDNLFNACPDDFALACHSIAAHPRPVVCVVTGFYIPTATPPAAETDGPLGAVFLARAFRELRVGCVVLSEANCADALRVGLRSAGCGWQEDWYHELRTARTPDAWHRSLCHGTPRATFPGPQHPWYAYLAVDWTNLLRFYNFTHLIALERAGPSRHDGCCYSMRAKDITEHTSPAHHIFDEVKTRHHHVVSIGIGDGGNEIGMGKVPWSVVAQNIPNGERIACRVATDRLIVAGVSNWAAYALAAGVAACRNVELPDELFDPARERKLLARMVEAGPLVDGVTGRQEVTVDGLSFDDYVRPLTEIGRILKG